MSNTQKAQNISDITHGNSTNEVSASEITGETGSNDGSRTVSARDLRSAKKRKKNSGKSKNLDRYQTVAQLGRGGWGVVEKAIDRQLQRPVAIKRIATNKTIAQEVRDRFMHEAKITSQLQHPGIVPVHELEDGVATGDLFYVMKLLSGKPLRQLIRDTHADFAQKQRKSTNELHEALIPLLERFIDVCDAVAYAHEQGVLHRDLKPDNVMIGGFGETIVVDWGLAKRIWDSQQSDEDTTIDHKLEQVAEMVQGEISFSDQTEDGSVIGTPAYMSPEQANGDIAGLTSATDIYSLGVTLYEILVGEHPHARLDVKSVLTRVRSGTYEPARQAKPEVPRPLSAICDCAMALDTEDRYATAIELADEVRRYIAGEPVKVDTEPITERVARWCKKNRTLTFAIAGLGLSLLVGSLISGYFIHQARLAESEAHQATQAAHRETILRLQHSRDAADTWLIELSGSLEFHPGLQSIREDLIDQAIKHYKELLNWEDKWVDGQPAEHGYLANENVSALHESLPEPVKIQIALEEIKVNLRLGDLFRLKQSDDLAVEHYDAAKSLIEKSEALSGVDGQSYDDLRLQRANVSIGNLLLGRSKQSDVDKSIGWLNSKIKEKEIDSAKPLGKKQSKFVYKLVSCRARIALAISRDLVSSNVEQSIASGKQSVEWAKWLVLSRGSLADRRLFETSTMQYACQCESKKQYEEAAIAWASLVKQFEIWTKESDDRIDQLQSLAYARFKWANSISANSSGPDDLTNACQQYKQAISEFKSAWALSDADGFFQRNLASAENNLGDLLSSGDAEQQNEARNHISTSLAIRKGLIRQQPSVDEIRLYCHSMAKLIQLDNQQAKDPDINILNEADTCFQLIRDHGRLTELDRQLWAQVLSARAALHDANGNSEQSLIDNANAKQLELSK